MIAVELATKPFNPMTETNIGDHGKRENCVYLQNGTALIL